MNAIAPIKAQNLELDQIFPGPLPGPVIGEEKVTDRTAPFLPLILQESYNIASRAGVPVKLVICRLSGVPARKDGSHEVKMLVPQSRPLFVVGTTI